MTPDELEAIKSMWLSQCGPCDYGMPEYGCSHPREDYRPVMMQLVTEIEQLRRTLPASAPNKLEDLLGRADGYLSRVEAPDHEHQDRVIFARNQILAALALLRDGR